MQTLYFCPVSFFFPRLISAVAEWMSIPYFGTWCGPSANLECRSEMCCTRLAGNAEPKNARKNRHLGTIAQLCRAISSQLRHVPTMGKNLLNSNISSRCPHNIANVLADWRLRSIYQFGPAQHIQRVSRLGSVTARHSSNGRQPNFAALNRGRHLYSAGRPSRWALAHILVPTAWLLVITLN